MKFQLPQKLNEFVHATGSPVPLTISASPFRAPHDSSLRGQRAPNIPMTSSRNTRVWGHRRVGVQVSKQNAGRWAYTPAPGVI